MRTMIPGWHAGRRDGRRAVRPFLGLWVLCLAVALCLGCGWPGGQAMAPWATRTPVATASPTPELQAAYVARVTDGDTIRVRIDGREYPLRYIGINCPEVGQPYADEATRANQDLVLHKTVLPERDVSETDRHGRLLRYVYLDDQMVNGILVQRGLANAGTYPPDVKHQDYLRALEQEAREAGRGFWAEGQ